MSDSVDLVHEPSLLDDLVQISEDAAAQRVKTLRVPGWGADGRGKTQIFVRYRLPTDGELAPFQRSSAAESGLTIAAPNAPGGKSGRQLTFAAAGRRIDFAADLLHATCLEVFALDPRAEGHELSLRRGDEYGLTTRFDADLAARLNLAPQPGKDKVTARQTVLAAFLSDEHAVIAHASALQTWASASAQALAAEIEGNSEATPP